MYTKFISKNIQEKLKAKERALARRTSTWGKEQTFSLELKDLASRTVFVRMCSNKVDGIDNILISGGEHKKGGGIPFGFSETYRDIYEKTKDGLKRKGIKGIPGIKDISVEYKGGFKAIREATINWSVPAMEYLDELTPYFLTVGKTVVVDWGWTYANKNTLQQQGINPFITSEAKEDGTIRYKVDQEIFTNPQERILNSNGDYDAIGGRIKNFNYSLREDGGFDCVTTITALGSALFHKPIDISGNFQGTRKTAADSKAIFAPPDSLINCMLNLRELIVTEVFGLSAARKGWDHHEILKSNFLTQDKSASKRHMIYHKEVKEAEGKKVTKRKSTYISDENAGSRYGIAADKKSNPNVLWLIQTDGKEDIMVTWGWFEDQILNRYLSYKGGDDKDIKMTMRSIDTVLNDEGLPIQNEAMHQSADESSKIAEGQVEDTGASFLSPEAQKLAQAEEAKLAGTGGRSELGDFVNTENLTKVKKRLTLIRNPDMLYPVNPFKFCCLETNGLVAGATADIFKDDLIKGFWDTEDKNAQNFLNQFVGLLKNPKGFNFDKKRFAVKDVKSKRGRLRNIWVNIQEIQRAFGIKDPNNTKDNTTDNVNPPGTLQNGVENLLSALNSNFHNIWDFEMVVDTYDSTNIKIIDKSDTEEDFPVYTKFEDNSNKVNTNGLYQFPSYKIGSIVKNQNLEFKIPDAQALTILYGSNKKKGESDGQQVNSRLDKLFRLDKHTVKSGENELDVYSDKFLSNLDTSNITVESNNVKSISVGSQNTSPNSKIINGFGLNINPDTTKYTWRKYSPELTKPGSVATSETTAAAFEITSDNKLLYVTRNISDGKQLKVDDKSYYTYDNDTKHLLLDEPAQSALNSFLNASSPTAQFDLNSLIPAELSLEIDGTGGILPGDLIHTDYIQNKYKISIQQVYKGENKEIGPVSYFQLFGITQTVDSTGWKTELKTKMRINKIPAEGVLEYETPQISYGSDEETNQSKPLPMPERPFVPVPSEEEDIAGDLTLDELEFEDVELIPVPPPPHLDPNNPAKQFRPDVPVPSADEDIAGDLDLDELEFDDPPPPYIPPSYPSTLKIRRAKQEIELKPEKVPGGLVPPDKQINIEIPELITDFPPDLGKPVGNWSDASYNNPEPDPKTKPIEPSAKVKKKPEDKDPETLQEQINTQKVIFIEPDPKVETKKKGEFPKKQKIEDPLPPKLDWDKPEEVVKKVNDNIKKEEPEEIEVAILPKEEITILQSTYKGTKIQNEVLYSVREDWRPLYLQSNGKPGGSEKDSNDNLQTQLRSGRLFPERKEFFDRYIEIPNKTGISKVITTNYSFDETPIENAGLLRTQRSIYWYGEWNPDY